jgi:hypothetical protein
MFGDKSITHLLEAYNRGYRVNEEGKVEETGQLVKFPFSELELGRFFNRRETVKKIKDGQIWRYTK